MTTPDTMHAVQYDHFGGIDVLEVRELPVPRPGPDEVLVRIGAAGINPGESALRSGAMAEVFPSTFPSGQGSDLAGAVSAVGDGVTAWRVGDEVVGWVDTRASHAEYAVVPVDQLVNRPAGLDQQVAGAVFVAGTTAWAAIRAVDPQPGEVLVVTAAAGGVGSLAVQLAVERGATVLGVAGHANHAWLVAHGAVPVDYSGGIDAVAARIRAAAPGGVDALVDASGQGYVDLGIDLGVAPARIDTVIDFAAAQRHGVQTAGSADAANRADLTEVVTRLADGRLELPIAAAYPLAKVRAAYTELEKRHTRGKIVLLP